MRQRPLDIDDLRAYAIARSLFAPVSLAEAVDRLGFVQADPIRAPARAQDLTLRHRVVGYRAGDLERRYHELPIEEDYFVNYGFLPRRHLALMHPRVARRVWDATTRRLAKRVLSFVNHKGTVHPRDVEAHFDAGTVTNYWGGSSNATTHLLDGMHYRGMLRVVRREAGIRVYAPALVPHGDGSRSRAELARALVDLAVAKYAPMPKASLGPLVSRIRFGAPHLARELKVALKDALLSIPHHAIDGTDWYFPESESPRRSEWEVRDELRFLAPFDPVVWDRRRFEAFWGWAYRFEAYTPAPKRKLGYYALPLLWRDRVIGWGTFSTKAGSLEHDIGFTSGRAPRERAFANALEAELERMRAFLGS